MCPLYSLSPPSDPHTSQIDIFDTTIRLIVKEGIASLASPIACYILTVTERILPTVGPVPVALF